MGIGEFLLLLSGMFGSGPPIVVPDPNRPIEIIAEDSGERYDVLGVEFNGARSVYVIRARFIGAPEETD